jgi:Flp pilus assembly protein CpaB
VTAAQHAATGAGPRLVVSGRRVVPSGRAVAGALLVALAMVGAYVLATGERHHRPPDVVVAARALAAGTRLRTSDLTVVPAELGGALLAATFRDPTAIAGRVVATRLSPGELVQASALEPAAGTVPVHEVALSLAPERTLASDLVTGDVVSVLATQDGCTSVVAATAVVQGISKASQTVTSGNQLVRLSLATDNEVIAVVHAQRTGEITLTRGSSLLDGTSTCTNEPAP